MLRSLEILATRLDKSWTHHLQLGLARILQMWDSPKFSEISSGLQQQIKLLQVSLDYYELFMAL